jgi:hypothetical protein
VGIATGKAAAITESAYYLLCKHLCSCANMSVIIPAKIDKTAKKVNIFSIFNLF